MASVTGNILTILRRRFQGRILVISLLVALSFSLLPVSVLAVGEVNSSMIYSRASKLKYQAIVSGTIRQEDVTADQFLEVERFSLMVSTIPIAVVEVGVIPIVVVAGSYSSVFAVVTSLGNYSGLKLLAVNSSVIQSTIPVRNERLRPLAGLLLSTMEAPFYVVGIDQLGEQVSVFQSQFSFTVYVNYSRRLYSLNPFDPLEEIRNLTDSMRFSLSKTFLSSMYSEIILDRLVGSSLTVSSSFINTVLLFAVSVTVVLYFATLLMVQQFYRQFLLYSDPLVYRGVTRDHLSGVFRSVHIVLILMGVLVSIIIDAIYIWRSALSLSGYLFSTISALIYVFIAVGILKNYDSRSEGSPRLELAIGGLVLLLSGYLEYLNGISGEFDFVLLILLADLIYMMVVLGSSLLPKVFLIPEESTVRSVVHKTIYRSFTGQGFIPLSRRFVLSTILFVLILGTVVSLPQSNLKFEGSNKWGERSFELSSSYDRYIPSSSIYPFGIINVRSGTTSMRLGVIDYDLIGLSNRLLSKDVVDVSRNALICKRNLSDNLSTEVTDQKYSIGYSSVRVVKRIFPFDLDPNFKVDCLSDYRFLNQSIPLKGIPILLLGMGEDVDLEPIALQFDSTLVEYQPPPLIFEYYISSPFFLFASILTLVIVFTLLTDFISYIFTSSQMLVNRISRRLTDRSVIRKTYAKITAQYLGLAALLSLIPSILLFLVSNTFGLLAEFTTYLISTSIALVVYMLGLSLILLRMYRTHFTPAKTVTVPKNMG